MFSPLFDGQFRSKPTVSLRGASKINEPSSKIVHKAHQLREERELLRKQTEATIIIQSYTRGHLTRTQIFNQLRSDFDNSLLIHSTDHTHLLSLTKRLLLFYNELKDHPRLVLLCQSWIKHKSSFIADLATPTNHTHLVICQLLTLCLHSLHSNTSQSLAGCLRLIDVFTNVSSFPRQQDTNPAHLIMKHCLKNEYFGTIRKLIEGRVPAPDEDTPTSIPLAVELLQFIERGIQLESDCLSYVLHELLAPPLSSHLCYIILPAIKRPHLLLSLISTAYSLVSTGQLEPSVTLVYCILTSCQSLLGAMNEESIVQLLSLLSLMFDTITVTSGTTGEEDDGEDVMELDPLGGNQSLINCIINIINSPSFVNRLSKINNYSDSFINGLSSICHHVISRTPSLLKSLLLSSLSLSSPLIKCIWIEINSITINRTFGPSLTAIDQLSRGFSLPSAVGVVMLKLLSSFCTLFSICLSSLHDTEINTLLPFSLQELVTVSLKLRDVFVVLHLETHLPYKGVFKTTPTNDSLKPHPLEWSSLANIICRLLRQLHAVSVRLSLLDDDEWACLSLAKVPPELFLEELEQDDSPVISQTAIKHAELLKKVPFIFPFTQRVTFFHRLISHSRYTTQGGLQDFMLGPSINITIRRSHMYEDAFSELHTADLRQKLRVNLINVHGLDEAGIDGGGLFREFLSETLKTGFNPNRGYFILSQEGQLYPNPQVHLISEDYTIHYQFLGALLGKALFEHMLVELPFASFFLRKLTTPNKGWVDTHYLSSLDSQLYRHLLSIKHYEGNIEELGLDFTTLSNEYGHAQLVELKSGGADISVTWSNRIEYIHLLAHYHLNVQLNSQFQAFRRGLNSVVPLLWLTLFNEQELQTLISGAQVSINIDDLCKHTVYSGVYNAEHETIKLFWSVVHEFDEIQKQQLLKFVTSCSRPPHLGFSELHPPFSILSARKTDHLPSASTCMHLLKLPMFTDRETLKDKLIYAISSGTGFELS